MVRTIVTGGAGFIGSHLVGMLLYKGDKVAALDNLSAGKKEFLKDHLSNPNFSFQQIDLLTEDISMAKTINSITILSITADL